MQGHIFLVQRK